jgi:hypothetical protein
MPSRHRPLNARSGSRPEHHEAPQRDRGRVPPESRQSRYGMGSPWGSQNQHQQIAHLGRSGRTARRPGRRCWPKSSGVGVGRHNSKGRRREAQPTRLEGQHPRFCYARTGTLWKRWRPTARPWVFAAGRLRRGWHARSTCCAPCVADPVSTRNADHLIPRRPFTAVSLGALTGASSCPLWERAHEGGAVAGVDLGESCSIDGGSG